MVAAHVAQLVEHVLGKDEVIGSNPIVGSSIERLVLKFIGIEQDSLLKIILM